MNHETYMSLALKLAEAGKGQTSPNPLVGAVVVSNGEIAGMGAHLKAGTPHAEVHAIQMAGEKAFGSTLYVTLEPCNHTGRTPPCTEKIIQSGIRKVVIGAKDPNPLVSGKGIARLKERGIEVVCGILEDRCNQLNEVFNHYIVHKRPFVILKGAVTLDGKIASYSGNSRWITGKEARMDVHSLRNEVDAILVGVGTIIHDNPKLTTRLPEGGKNPIRIILDSTLRIPLESHVVTDHEADTWIFTSVKSPIEKREQLEEKGVKLYLTGNGEKINIHHALEVMGSQGITSLLVEGGSEINGSFLEEKLINKLVLYIAPKIIGGANARPFIGGAGFSLMSEAVPIERIQIDEFAGDIRIMGYPKYKT
ncbi:bifunctional diaminohydroxyphosphoribosylaminopyrimidine deaminase/5-amino-6-(5-phosphoribosylamino)uracil reductase RibD [Microaerobacter geothermalis]|uniref:bifunctional diaminohydroxyphosphoribosylaminopyrimidine deaminase/5-amino-6-(5-phosphoribosylamino)uracil reductase RibD n=1 Tax=Microaerobacter geothermalis TaxID=674972 RepID=UPI001F016EF4|nr:bifunctional diaminohydroxyphosphoribosylaminopyrimidine deaminase/5-amino-6-(5-phosphoribosylamino)uracil reductase RibD [Microaerobacter geothermalis]MCF6093480.1 bifunctional diaminohydroxyphosphoribosylaminopyrimidine deaminase/5-amino-6-(5-phosphoribosylamino)uracil reductase RibD [Microaerobacter geothermalis]